MTGLDLWILGAASALRIALNNVTAFSGSDEAVVRSLALQASDKNYDYPLACERWFNEPRGWKFPGILRFGNILLLGALYRLTLSSGFRVMTSVSTAAGIATVWLSWLLAAQVAPGTETSAALLVALSPLGLHLGRRALQDAQTCALALGAIVATLYGHPIIAAASLATMVAFKETTLTHVPPVALFLLIAVVPANMVALILFTAGSFYLSAFIGFGGSLRSLPKYRRAVRAARDDAYGQHQRGGIHRLFIDLILLSPFPMIAAMRSTSSAAPAALFVFALLLIHAALPVLQSVRMVSTADVMVRLIAATTLHGWWLFAAVMFDAAIFLTVFVREGVYDPVTANLVTALGMVPSPKQSAN